MTPGAIQNFMAATRELATCLFVMAAAVRAGAGCPRTRRSLISFSTSSFLLKKHGDLPRSILPFREIKVVSGDSVSF